MSGAGRMRAAEPMEAQSDLRGAPPVGRRRAAARCTWASIGVNAGLSAAQVAAGLLAASQGLIADGIHSLSDLAADFVVLIAGRRSQREADEDHPYGHLRYETAAALALGALLAMVGLGVLWSAFRRLETPAAVGTVGVIGVWAVGVSLLAKELLFRYMIRVAERVRSSMLIANAWHARADAASSLVVGVGVLGNLAGYPILDPIAALIVGLMVSRMGLRFGWDALQDLMDHAVAEEEVAAIRGTLLATPGVEGVHDIRTRKMGDLILVDAHLEVDGTLSVAAGHAIALAARERVLARHRVLNVMTHIDPAR